ncbi:exodeoxyribonuclease V subunit alpha [Halorhodospira halochloris]|uniref:exodeoxyribonuclease V subunit alpha n=1 Tax=Halorhodospira halochloris TaxID=1052 RepID=UPI001EE96DD5|nr:exodeoxyribonuclease V subunit alpha [Halorhodospira halochloris]MCG5548367.1 exodeoxyribonuclease V subunit alpha [Halorhodospira halochloris]
MSAASHPLDSATATLALLQDWRDCDWLRPLDHALVAFLHDQAPGTTPATLLCAALVSHQAGRGHVCLDLDALLSDPDRSLSLPPEDGRGAEAMTEQPLPRPAQCLSGLDRSTLVATLNADSDVVGAPIEASPDADEQPPLILDGHRLYLRRYWQSERRIAVTLERRMAQVTQWRDELEPKAVRRWLDTLFGPQDPTETWQRLACAVAAGSGFAVVTGGPGTGKTTTVVRLLALLQGLRRDAEQRPLRIRMAAPTGKAAARLNASVAGTVHGLNLPDEQLRANIPTEVTTIHRLLGVRPGSRRFRHDADNLLPLDVLVVDEASMIDVELMASTLAALPPRARLILLGDHDQLASVEAGAVLGELCQRAAQGHYMPTTCDWLESVSGESIPEQLRDTAGSALDQHVVMLRHSHRFAADSGIGRLANAVNSGDIATAKTLLATGGYTDLHHQHLRGPDDNALEELAEAGYRPYLEAVAARPDATATAAEYDEWAHRVLTEHGRFQLLTALRRGPWGVEGLNRRIAARLAASGLIESGAHWYPGRPVMVTRNDYELGLNNGDIGIALPLPDTDEPHRTTLRVAFPAADGGKAALRWVLPARLNNIETVFAMTVHKAQGSEFDHAALLLPDRPSPILTRELIYTAITRARNRFTLLDPGHGVLAAGLAARVNRSAGLHDQLIGMKPPGNL